MQLKATLDLLLKHPTLGPQCAPKRIALIGFGTGGSAGLLLAGATLTTALWPAYLEQGLKTDPVDPYCQPALAAQMDALRQGITLREDRLHDAAYLQEQAVAARGKALQRMRDQVEKAYGRVLRSQRRQPEVPKPPFFLPLPPPVPQNTITDPRFQALVLVSPGLSMFFDPASLQNVRIPTLIIGAEADVLNRPSMQALALRAQIKPAPAYVSIPEADGPSFMSICPPDMARDLPDLCESVSPQTRQDIHDKLLESVTAFLAAIPTATTAPPTPTAPATERPANP